MVALLQPSPPALSVHIINARLCSFPPIQCDDVSAPSKSLLESLKFEVYLFISLLSEFETKFDFQARANKTSDSLLPPSIIIASSSPPQCLEDALKMPKRLPPEGAEPARPTRASSRLAAMNQHAPSPRNGRIPFSTLPINELPSTVPPKNSKKNNSKTKSVQKVFSTCALLLLLAS